MHAAATDELKGRTKRFSLQVATLYAALPKQVDGQALGRELLRVGTAVSARYRAAYESETDARYLTEAGGSLTELDETIRALAQLAHRFPDSTTDAPTIRREAAALTALINATIHAARQRRAPPPAPLHHRGDGEGPGVGPAALRQTPHTGGENGPPLRRIARSSPSCASRGPRPDRRGIRAARRAP